MGQVLWGEVPPSAHSYHLTLTQTSCRLYMQWHIDHLHDESTTGSLEIPGFLGSDSALGSMSSRKLIGARKMGMPGWLAAILSFQNSSPLRISWPTSYRYCLWTNCWPTKRMDVNAKMQETGEDQQLEECWELTAREDPTGEVTNWNTISCPAVLGIFLGIVVCA